ncbi:retrovirus-related pol polyprotein from transposon TNT 1-94, partial [Tanacetum coccineum]
GNPSTDNDRTLAGSLYHRTVTERTKFSSQTLIVWCFQKNSNCLMKVYVDDIIFGSTNKAWCDEFEVLMKGEFEMSVMGEMSFFLVVHADYVSAGHVLVSADRDRIC